MPGQGPSGLRLFEGFIVSRLLGGEFIWPSFLSRALMITACLQPMEPASASLAMPAQVGLTDYRMQELLLQEILPHLGPACLAHLRACCRSLQSLLDSKLCSDVWFQAAQHHLPSRHHLHHEAQPSPFLLQQQKSMQASDTITGVNQQQQQQQQQQSQFQDRSAPRHPADHSPAHPVHIQQLLQEQAALQHSLSHGGSLSFKPLPVGAAYSSSELWSPCGTWVAMRPYWPETRTSSLVIWNTHTGAAQEMSEYPQGQLLSMAWLPAGPCLAWIRSHTASQYEHRTIFCMDVTTGERHQVLVQPCQTSQHRQRFIISASGGLIAYNNNSGQASVVELASLPHLKKTATLSSPLHPSPSVLTMEFNPAATHIAILWDGTLEKANAGAAPFCLEIIDTQTQACRFSRTFNHAILPSWSPSNRHLLIARDARGLVRDSPLILDVSTWKVTAVPVKTTYFAVGEPTWSATGSTVIIPGSRLDHGNNADCTEFYVVLSNGTVGFKWTYGIQGPRLSCGENTLDSPSEGTLDEYRLCETCLTGLNSEISDILDDHSFNVRLLRRGPVSSCGRVVVAIDSLDPVTSRLAEVMHFEMDYPAHSATKQSVLRSYISKSSAPIWHPSLVGSRIYALAGHGHDVLLVDGRQHRVLQHLHGKDLLSHARGARLTFDTQAGSTWRISWSEDGTKLLLVGEPIVIAIDFCSLNGHICLPESHRPPICSPPEKMGFWGLIVSSLTTLSELFWI